MWQIDRKLYKIYSTKEKIPKELEQIRIVRIGWGPKNKKIKATSFVALQDLPAEASPEAGENRERRLGKGGWQKQREGEHPGR